MKKKQKLGQFYSRNADTILVGMESAVEGRFCADPFVGQRDLLLWAHAHGAKYLVGYDIDQTHVNRSKNFHVHYNDSIRHPENVNPRANFLLTNPPYLGKNKTKNQAQFGEWDDLYQAAIAAYIGRFDEGIFIVPVNFLSAENSAKLRRQFFSVYDIVRVNYFKTRMFEDTSYNVVAVHFVRASSPRNTIDIPVWIYPDEQKIVLTLSESSDWTIGGEEVSQIRNTPNQLKLSRLQTSHFDKSEGVAKQLHLNDVRTTAEFTVSPTVQNILDNNVVLLQAIDDRGTRIRFYDKRTVGVEGLVGLNTSRTLAHIIFPESVSVEEQEALIENANAILTRLREATASLFLTNFRDNDRKRISFEFAYSLINFIWQKEHLHV